MKRMNLVYFFGVFFLFNCLATVHCIAGKTYTSQIISYDFFPSRNEYNWEGAEIINGTTTVNYSVKTTYRKLTRTFIVQIKQNHPNQGQAIGSFEAIVSNDPILYNLECRATFNRLSGSTDALPSGVYGNTVHSYDICKLGQLFIPLEKRASFLAEYNNLNHVNPTQWPISVSPKENSTQPDPSKITFEMFLPFRYAKPCKGWSFNLDIQRRQLSQTQDNNWVSIDSAKPMTGYEGDNFECRGMGYLALTPGYKYRFKSQAKHFEGWETPWSKYWFEFTVPIAKIKRDQIPANIVKQSDDTGINENLKEAASKLVPSGTPAVETFSFTSPNGGEQWHKESTYDITWNKGGKSGNFKIVLLKNGVFYKRLKKKILVDAEKFQWIIGEKINTGDSYKIRLVSVTDANNKVESNNVFSIMGKLQQATSLGLKKSTKVPVQSKPVSLDKKGALSVGKFFRVLTPKQKTEYVAKIKNLQGVSGKPIARVNIKILSPQKTKISFSLKKRPFGDQQFKNLQEWVSNENELEWLTTPEMFQYDQEKYLEPGEYHFIANPHKHELHSGEIEPIVFKVFDEKTAKLRENIKQQATLKEKSTVLDSIGRSSVKLSKSAVAKFEVLTPQNNALYHKSILTVRIGSPTPVDFVLTVQEVLNDGYESLKVPMDINELKSSDTFEWDGVRWVSKTEVTLDKGKRYYLLVSTDGSLPKGRMGSRFTILSSEMIEKQNKFKTSAAVQMKKSPKIEPSIVLGRKLLSDEIKMVELKGKKTVGAAKQPSKVTSPFKRTLQEKNQTKPIQKYQKEAKQKVLVNLDKPKFRNLKNGQAFSNGNTIVFNLKLNQAYNNFKVKYEVYQNACKGKAFKVSTKNNFGKLPAGKYCVRAAYMGGKKMNWSKGIPFVVEKKKSNTKFPNKNISNKNKLMKQ